MKKKSEDFSSALKKMELESLKRSEQKKIEARRIKMIETLEEKKAVAKKETLLQEADISRKGDIRDKLGITFSVGVTALLFIVPYYRKQPVDFWFYVIVGMCYVSFYFFYKNSK